MAAGGGTVQSHSRNSLLSWVSPRMSVVAYSNSGDQWRASNGHTSTQMPQYEKDKDRFAEYDATVLGISVDSAPSHAAWAQSFGGVSFDLLSDFHPKGEVSRAYGTFREEDGFSNRDIFIVDKEGKIVYIDRHAILDVPKNEELFAVLESLR